MLSLEKCPVCSSPTFSKHLVCKDFTVSKEDFTIVSCSSCDFKFTNPRPADSVLGNYYKSDDYISHTNTKKGLISRLYHLVRNYTLNIKIRLVTKYVSRGTLLDYGCGTGMFLNVCKDMGWESFGIEPDIGAANIAINMGISVFSNKAKLQTALPNTKFDAITLWHVLEHVTDLDDTLLFIKERLNTDGTLIIAVPNYTSYDAIYYKEFWAAYDVPRHLYHFNKVSIEKLLAKFGFNLIESLPMKFDSFYVSMLSEKYKTGSIKYLNAFILGLKSNLKAKSAENYSSVIYIFKLN